MTMPIAKIDSLDHEGRGVTRVEGKAVFVEGALPGERVEYVVRRAKPSYEQGETVRVLRPSAQRVAPRCPHYGVCGGCSMQHLDADAQAAVKQRILEDALRHIGKLRPGRILPAVHGPAWGYRYRARLGVRMVPSKGGLRVGFHERRSSYIVDMRTCPVLPLAISALLPRLRTMLAGLSIADRLPQVEIAVGEDSTVFVFRNLLPFSAADEKRLAAFADLGRLRRGHGLTRGATSAARASEHRERPQEEPGGQSTEDAERRRASEHGEHASAVRWRWAAAQRRASNPSMSRSRQRGSSRAGQVSPAK